MVDQYEYFDRTLTSFEDIGSNMNKLTEDGKIKKKTKRKGVGLNPPPTAIVSILYITYLEYEEEPLDLSYSRKPYKFQLDCACLSGLNYAVLSMKVKEVAYFLIHPDYAYGKIGHPPRVISNSVILTRVELLQFSDSKLGSIYDKITCEQTKKFSGAQKLSLALMDNAKILMSKNIHFAIREYRKAFKLLVNASLKDDIEEHEQKKLKIRLLTNLAICYNKENLPKKTCIMCNEIFKMSKNTAIIIPAKVYFNNARALITLGNYKFAMKQLIKAHKMEQNNRIINQEMVRVNNKIIKEREREKQLAKIYVESIHNHETNNDIKSSETETRELLLDTSIKLQTELSKEVNTDNFYT